MKNIRLLNYHLLSKIFIISIIFYSTACLSSEEDINDTDIIITSNNKIYDINNSTDNYLEDNEKYTLEAAIEDALSYNYSIKSASEGVEITKSGRIGAYGSLLPKISIDANRTFSDYRSKTIQNLSDNQVNNINLSVVQPIFTGFSSINAIKKNNYDIKSSKAFLKSTKNSTIFSAVAAYENLLTNRNVLDLSKKNEEIMRQHLDFANTSFSVGAVTKTDVVQAKAALAQSIADKYKAEGDVESSEAVFLNIIGKIPPKILSETNITNNFNIPYSLEDLVEASYINNPDLIKAENDWYAAKKNADTTIGNIFPSISASMERSRSNNKNNRDGSFYSINVSVPLFQVQNIESISKSKHIREQLKYQYELMKNNLRKLAVEAWSDYKIAEAIITATNDQVEAAEQVLEGVEEEAKIGARTTLDVLNAQRDLFIASINHKRAKTQRILSIYKMRQLINKN